MPFHKSSMPVNTVPKSRNRTLSNISRVAYFLPPPSIYCLVIIFLKSLTQYQTFLSVNCGFLKRNQKVNIPNSCELLPILCQSQPTYSKTTSQKCLVVLTWAWPLWGGGSCFHRRVPFPNQCDHWTDPCGSYYNCKTPFSNNHQEIWGEKSLLLTRS